MLCIALIELEIKSKILYPFGPSIQSKEIITGRKIKGAGPRFIGPAQTQEELCFQLLISSISKKS